ncbi:hypothetical protein K503DRAFT_187088 [Rhizopogon vinicolor AM-OR11-026]|uniref:Uncharacterized protein n=1 Tax=Rhizopogon vinicolor AM-OR11-026 TaxID=1314800 RepID=A0A1B7MZM9_9AGAM|nr:hypothetical protein K503DRAFT_187088 [Rhizopogon vinicolor AM-OR11-026]
MDVCIARWLRCTIQANTYELMIPISDAVYTYYVLVIFFYSPLYCCIINFLEDRPAAMMSEPTASFISHLLPYRISESCSACTNINVATRH